MSHLDPSAPSRVRFEHLGPDALGIGEPRPRLSWHPPEEPAQGTTATSAEIRVHARDGVTTITRDDPTGVLQPWVGEPLSSGERRTVQVRLRHADGSASPWSAPSFVEAGLLDPAEWRGEFIGEVDDTAQRPTAVRRIIPLDGEVVRARLHATAHGLYDPIVNGRRLDDAVLEPGWQSYRHRLRYRTYDITADATGRVLSVGALLADGWYRGRLGFPLIAQEQVYGSELGLLAQIEIEYADGRRDVIPTDVSWDARGGPISHAGLYDGEDYDARREVDWWGQGDWGPARAQGGAEVRLVPPSGPPVRATQTLPPQRIWRSPSGRTLVDFGQNLVGWIRIHAEGRIGDSLHLRHAEVLERGELAVRPLRTAAARDTYVFGADGPVTWEPRFTYHGFRYVEVDGWPDALPMEDRIEAVVVHTDMTRTGWFSCSDDLLNRLHDNVVWSMRGNFVDIPTDCPQRDERLGWTGDLAVFAPTATYLYDCIGMLGSWLEDLSAEQRADGTVPFFVPELEFPDDVRHLPGLDPQPAAVWGDAAVLVPMALYGESADVEILRRQYPSMTAWVDLVERLAGPHRLWTTGFQFGDWLDPNAPAHDPAAGRTEPALVATAYFAQSARLLADAAEVLDRADDATRYRALADDVGRAFRERFVDGATGLMSSDSQTAYALAVCFDLVSGPVREQVGAQLVRLVRADRHRIATGFVGTPLVLHALTAVGAHDDAAALLLQRESPSWLHTVLQGATTIWERWDSLLPDGSVNPGEMTSFNHYAFGAVADWMHQHIGGLRRTAPGWASFLVAPRPCGGITQAATSHVSPHGPISVAWELDADRLTVEVDVPVGTIAELDLPGRDRERLDAGRHVRITVFDGEGLAANETVGSTT
ncbi:family 78 glycoside hydrolase catalytic domain [Microbacterium sp. NPDC090218]